jgi:hypothetical protein
VEDRISEIKGKIEIKNKTEEILVKQVKSYEINVQGLSNTIKRPNLRIMGIDGEVVQAKGICNISNKIITEIFPLRYRKPPGHQTDLTKIEPLHGILSLKQQAQGTVKEY